MTNETLRKNEASVTSNIEKLDLKDLQEYSDFFISEIKKDSVYGEEELNKIIRQHSVENIIPKISDPNHLLYVLRRDGKMVGVLEAKVVGRDEKNKLLSQIFNSLGLKENQAFGYMSWILSAESKEGNKRSGVATELYNKGIEELNKLGIKFFVAGMRTGNEASINLHKKMMFFEDLNLPKLDGYQWYTRRS